MIYITISYKMLFFTLLKFFIIHLLLFLCVEAEIITISSVGWVLGSAILGGSLYEWDKIKDNTVCRFTECCNSKYIPYDLEVLEKSLSSRMHGQPLVYEILNILSAHKASIDGETKSNSKPLVISLHGWTGVGKNHAVNMIAEALYTKGMKSKYVKVFMGKKSFDCTDIKKSQDRLIETVHNIVKSCPKSLIVFDEIHDMCPDILDAIKPMLDHHHAVDGIDYRDSIFIYISNIGGSEITHKLLELYSQGVTRNDVAFYNFEPLIRRIAYEKGGFEKSSTIAQHMIDHYIPFLPLEQQHVEKCAIAEFKAHGITEVTDDIMAHALSVITYGPTEDQPIFANSGCKRIPKHIAYIIKKYNLKPSR